MIISKAHKFVFISTPKTGTHTMYQVLPELYEGEQKEGAYHQTVVPEEYKDFYVFTTVRNPFERTVSIWHALIQRENYSNLFLPRVGAEDFLSFVKWLTSLDRDERPKGKGGVLLHPQSEWLEGVDYDKFIKIEEVDSEFSNLPFYSEEIGPSSIPKVLARKHQVWEDVKCEESRKLIVNWAKRDFELFGYDTNY